MSSQNDYIKTQVRIPKSLHDKVVNSSELSGRSMNSEILYLIEKGFGTTESDLDLFNNLSRSEQAFVREFIINLNRLRNS